MLLLAVSWLAGMVYGVWRKPPSGLSRVGPWRRAADLRFLRDINYERAGRRVHEQQILPALLAAVAGARRFIIADFFLFNRLGAGGAVATEQSPVARLTEALLAARQARPELPVLLITDEINTGYGSYAEPHLERLRANGVQVIITRLEALPDSNPFYSGLWRPFLQWFKPMAGRGRLLNPFGPGGPSLGWAAWLRLLNFKANHRKLLLTEQVALVASANVHDGSAQHSNIAFAVAGPVIADLAAGELAVARFSGGRDLPREEEIRQAVDDAEARRCGAAERLPDEELRLRVVSERGIRRALLAAIEQSTAGETIWLAHFYFAQRRVMKALAAAARRGAQVRLILDSSREAFGYDKRGIPNRASAARLYRLAPANLAIRWYHTGSEQFHAKLLLVIGSEQAVIIGGSANLTRRNLNGYNLETDLEIRAPRRAPVSREVEDFFQRLWENRGGLYTLDYETLADDSRLKAAWAAFQERTGLGTF